MMRALGEAIAIAAVVVVVMSMVGFVMNELGYRFPSETIADIREALRERGWFDGN